VVGLYTVARAAGRLAAATRQRVIWRLIWLYAYIGVGQMTDMPESERRGWAFAMDAARRSGNAQAIHQLQSIAPYFAPGHPNQLKDLYLQRKWIGYFGGVMAFRHDNDADSDLVKLSPDYTPEELRHIYDGNKFAERFLLTDLVDGDWSVARTLGCPLFLFEGRHDFNANSKVAWEWFEKVQAPAKQFVWFDRAHAYDRGTRKVRGFPCSLRAPDRRESGGRRPVIASPLSEGHLRDGYDTRSWFSDHRATRTCRIPVR
jgi:hypothetical protein